MFSFNFTSRSSDEEKLTTELGLLSKFNAELMDFVTKLELFIERQKKLLLEHKHCHVCLHHVVIPVRITMMV